MRSSITKNSYGKRAKKLGRTLWGPASVTACGVRRECVAKESGSRGGSLSGVLRNAQGNPIYGTISLQAAPSPTAGTGTGSPRSAREGTQEISFGPRNATQNSAQESIQFLFRSPEMLREICARILIHEFLEGKRIEKIVDQNSGANFAQHFGGPEQKSDRFLDRFLGRILGRSSGAEISWVPFLGFVRARWGIGWSTARLVFNPELALSLLAIPSNATWNSCLQVLNCSKSKFILGSQMRFIGATGSHNRFCAQEMSLLA